MNTALENRSVPKLRFKGFNEEWKIMKLGELFKISAGGDISKEYVSNRKTEDFKYPIFANAVKNKGLYGYSNKYKIEGNVITVTGRGNLGVAHSRKQKFYPIVRLLVLRPKDDCNVDYFENRINLMKIFNESTGVPQLTAPQLSTYNISYPSILEQNKLAEFLSSIDKKIKLLDKKKEKLQRYKKGVMQKIFSQEILFKDDDGNYFDKWEFKNFDEIFDIISHEEISIKEIKESGMYNVVEQGKEKKYRFSNDEKKLIKNETFIVYGDHTTEIKFIDFDFIAGPSLKFLKCLESYNLKFMFYNLIFNNIKPEGYKRHFSILKRISLKVPRKEEQKKIGHFLSSVDKKIDSVSVQIEKTKEFKKGLLQQMFV